MFLEKSIRVFDNSIIQLHKLGNSGNGNCVENQIVIVFYFPEITPILNVFLQNRGNLFFRQSVLFRSDWSNEKYRPFVVNISSK